MAWARPLPHGDGFNKASGGSLSPLIFSHVAVLCWERLYPGFFLEERQLYCACALSGLGRGGLTLVLGPCGRNTRRDGRQGSASQPVPGPLRPSQPAVQVGVGSAIVSLARTAGPEPVLTWCQRQEDRQCLIWHSLRARTEPARNPSRWVLGWISTLQRLAVVPLRLCSGARQVMTGSSPHSPGLFPGALRVPCVLPQVTAPGGTVCPAEAVEEPHRQLLRVHLPALFQAN